MAKVKLHAMPLTLVGMTILAIHTPWGLNPMYSLAEIVGATPGATYTLSNYRADIGPPVSTNDAYWRSGALSGSTAWAILATRLRQLGKIPADSFPDTPHAYSTQSEENRRVVLELVRGLLVTTGTPLKVPLLMLSSMTAQCVYLCGSQRLRNDGPLGAPV